MEENRNGITVKQVQLADLEDAAHVPPGRAVVGAQVGNLMWRCPEAHAAGAVNKPSDIFSFGIVVSRQSRCNLLSFRIANDQYFV